MYVVGFSPFAFSSLVALFQKKERKGDGWVVVIALQPTVSYPNTGENIRYRYLVKVLLVG